MIANKTFNTADLEATIGAPSTKPAKAINIGLSGDYYFKSVGLVSLGLFYKDIKNVNIEWASNKYLGSDLGLGGDYAKVGYLDLNTSYTWGKKTKFTVYANANNLLNQPLRYYQGVSDRTMQVEYYGVKVYAGIKVNL